MRAVSQKNYLVTVSLRALQKSFPIARLFLPMLVKPVFVFFVLKILLSLVF